MEKKVLIIEEDPGMRELWDVILTYLKLEIVFLENTSCNIDEIGRVQPVLIIKDVPLLNDCSFQEIKKIKYLPSTSDIPLIIYSTQPRFKTWAKGSLADAIVEKPFDLIDMENTILDLIQISSI